MWFTSDTHFGHTNIIKYSHRPYSSVEEMDEALIRNWNDIVEEGDIIYHLGDFSFHKPDTTRMILGRLKGEKYLLLGNHDYKRAKGLDMFQWVGEYKYLKHQGQRITLMHYPLGTWYGAHKGAWNLHGHSHGNYKARGKQLDVGVDPQGYKPIHYDEVQEYMNKREFLQVDHHKKKFITDANPPLFT